MKFIQEYIWNIFEIKYNEKCDFDEAFKMFIFNIELGYERYRGAKGVSYKKLNKKWEKINWFAKEELYPYYKSITRKYAISLIKAFNNNDRLAFQAICNQKI